jgi:signal peptidase I
MDLAAILVALVAVSGAIWLYDKFKLAPRRALAHATAAKSLDEVDPRLIDEVPVWVDLGRSLFPVFIIVLILRSFLLEPFRIPSGSMMPTLLVGDFILVNKYSYGLRLPVLNTKFLSIGEPARGDVVVFRYPEDPAIPFIKRIVGMPGDKLEYNYLHKTLYINGELVARDFIGSYQGVGQGSNMTGSEEYLEHLPGNVDHPILLRSGLGHPSPYIWSPDTQTMQMLQNKPSETLSEYERNSLTMLRIDKIPEKQYFVLGDNRDNSKDSRYWGMVPEENLIGKAFLIWMNWDLSNKGINWPRLGTKIP